MTVDEFKDTVQDCNLNFLIGSGLSCPFLTTLGDIEGLLTELDQSTAAADQKMLVRASLYKHYFDSVIKRNLEIIQAPAGAADVSAQYEAFLSRINTLLHKRKGTILGKEVNIFTTNIDIFLDKALERLNLEYNDGFNGRFEPKFSLSNFKKSRFKKSLHYDKTAELPVFNLMKLHGSLSWQIVDGNVTFSPNLSHVAEVEKSNPATDQVVEVTVGAKLDDLLASADKKTPDAVTAFLKAYDDLLLVVNPTKDKFRHTLMNQTYYELLRLFSNELEKENTLLFVMGFSFADEHIREITLRAANSNPTLTIKVIAFDGQEKHKIQARFGHNVLTNNNLEVIAPEQEMCKGGTAKDKFNYEFSAINERILGSLLRSVECE